MRTFFKAVTFILLWGILLGGGYLFYEVHTFLTTPGAATAQEVIFSIQPGSTFDRVAWDLKKAGIITDVMRFRLLARYHDAQGKVKAGEFLLNSGWTPDKVLYQITQGQARLYRLSIREGLTWWETAKTIEAQGFARYEDFRDVIHDPAFLREHGIPFANAEGFLYPETYLLKKPRSPLDKEQAREVADVMVRMFWKKTEPLWRQLPLRPGLESREAPLPDAPLLPSTPGAMSSSPSPAPGGTAVFPGPWPGRSATLEPGSSPANVGTALPGAKSVVEFAAGPDPEGQAWPVTIAASDPGREEDMSAIWNRTQKSMALAGQTQADGTEGQAGQAGASPQVPAQGPDGQPLLTAPGSDGAPVADPAGAGSPPPAGAGAGGAPSSTPAAGSAAAQGPRSPAEVDPGALRYLVTLASLVEKETGVPEERGRVAGVYANRLRLNMLLQCDPTIIYGVGPSFSGAIRRSQLDDPGNLYNTYQHPGLPPGPICSSGLWALEAAFAPEKHDYLYFVATGTDASHTFSKSLAEHNRAVQIYRERMRAVSNKNK